MSPDVTDLASVIARAVAKGRVVEIRAEWGRVAVEVTGQRANGEKFGLRDEMVPAETGWPHGAAAAGLLDLLDRSLDVSIARAADAERPAAEQEPS